MIKLVELLNEELLKELSDNSTLYHHSIKLMNPGEEIKIHKDPKTHQHWLKNSKFEKALDYFRQKYYPNRPSRFNSIYSTPIPRSRFADKGYLYVIKPSGNMFMTNSQLIDSMHEDFNRKFYTDSVESEFQYKYGADWLKQIIPRDYLFCLDEHDADNYWNGASGNIKDLEILSEKAIVIERIENKNELISNRKVEVTENGKLYCSANFYFYLQNSNNDNTLNYNSIHEIESEIEKIKKLFFNIEYHTVEQRDAFNDQYVAFQISGTLAAHTQYMIINTILTKYFDISTNELKHAGKYKFIQVIPIINNKILNYKRRHPYSNMKIMNSYTNEYPMVYDFGKYLKVI